MCYKAPGPRCSRHAEKDVQNKQKTYNLLRIKEDGIKHRMDSYAASHPDAENTSSALLAEHQEVSSQIIEAGRDFRDARLTYDSTPRGQKTLESGIKSHQDALVKYPASFAGTQERLAELKDRLRVGKSLREAQISAFKKAYPSEVLSEEDSHAQKMENDPEYARTFKISKLKLSQVQKEAMQKITAEDAPQEFDNGQIALSTLTKLSEQGLVSFRTKTKSASYGQGVRVSPGTRIHGYTYNNYQVSLTDLGKEVAASHSEKFH